MDEYRIGEFVSDMGHLGGGGAVGTGLAVGCPACDKLFMMDVTELRELVGETRPCPYCQEVARIPQQLPRIQDLRPHFWD